MKRRWIFFLLIITMFPLSTVAETYYSYGQKIQEYTMYEALSASKYWNIYKGQDCTEISLENAYRGKSSMRVNVDALLQTEDKRFTFDTVLCNNAYEIEKNALYMEFFVYGIDEMDTDVSFRARFEDFYYKNFQKEATEKDGWYRVWALIPASTYKNYSAVRMSIDYPAERDTNPPRYLYFDEMSIRFVPQFLAIDTLYCAESQVALKDIRVFGKNSDGDRASITNTDDIVWTVVSGNGEIVDGVLYYKGDDAGSVVLKANYFSVEETMEVYLNQGVAYGEMQEVSPNFYQMQMQNHSSQTAQITILTAIYDGDELYSCNVNTLTIPNGETMTFTTEELRHPVTIKEYKVKFYIYDDISDQVFIKNG